jgi:hypothetical protein
MLKINANVDTLLKTRCEDSSLFQSDNSPVKRGSEFVFVKTEVTMTSNSHITWVESGKRVYAYYPHFDCEFSYSPTSTMSQNIIHACIAFKVVNLKEIAYVLATAEGESNFKPIKELRGTVLTSDQQRYWHAGYMGRGLVQLTWEENYAKFAKRLEIDLVNKPELALMPDVAIKVLIIGMRDGLFTSHSLDDSHDWTQMRLIINPGQVRYPQYAKHVDRFNKLAVKWYKALTIL